MLNSCTSSVIARSINLIIVECKFARTARKAGGAVSINLIIVECKCILTGKLAFNAALLI